MPAKVLPPSAYGRPTILQIAAAVVGLFTFPAYLITHVILSPFHPAHTSSSSPDSKNGKPWSRVIYHAFTYWVTLVFHFRVIQAISGSAGSEGIYREWAQKLDVGQGENVKEDVEVLENGLKLMWIGPRDAQNVVLYFHGGCFVTPMNDLQLNFWRSVRSILRKRDGVECSIAILQYTLVPQANFPVPLTEAQAAFAYVSSRSPSARVYLAGDSAGGNLILQLLTHFLHPLSGIPAPPAAPKVSGALLISPWVSLSGKETGGSNDVLSRTAWRRNGQAVLAALTVPDGSVPRDAMLYLNASSAPSTHLANISSLFPSSSSSSNESKKILVTNAQHEFLQPSIASFVRTHLTPYIGVEYLEERGAVHIEPILDMPSWAENKFGNQEVWDPKNRNGTGRTVSEQEMRKRDLDELGGGSRLIVEWLARALSEEK